MILKGSAEKAIKGFFDAYLVKRDLHGAALYLTKDIQWIGTGKNECVHNLEEAYAFLSDEFSKDTTPYRICFHGYTETVVSDDCAVALFELDVEPTAAGGESLTMRVRVTAVCRREEACKIVSLHASCANTMQGDGEYFPAAYPDNNDQEFERRIGNKTVELLGKNFPGGTMGGYLEEDYPLYYVNDRMLEYLGYTYDEFVTDIQGKIANCFHPGDRERVDREVMEAFSKQEEYEVQYRMRKKDGSYIWVNDIGKKGIAEDGRRICISVIRDISNEREAREKLMAEVAEREKQALRYDQLFQSVLCGIVQYQMEPGGTVVFKDANQEAIRIFGYNPREFWSRKNWNIRELTAEEDREAMIPIFMGLSDLGNSASFEYRVLRKDGGPLWIIGSAEVICNIDGELVIQSVFLDIDKTKKAELINQKLARQVEAGNELLKMALEHTTSYEFYYYPLERLCMNPERTQRRYGCEERYENMPASFREAFVAKGCEEAYDRMYERIDSGEKTAAADFKSKIDGSWCRVTLSTVDFTEENKPAFVVGIVEDITQAMETRLALEETRSRDSLTGLYTKEAGIGKIKEYMINKDPEQICAMMILDIDQFSEINKAEGRAFADAILQEISSLMENETKEEDYLVRLGGDEFMLFIKDCDKAMATVIGPRIARKVQSLYQWEEGGPALSVSIGMCVTAVADEYSGLYRCAESALSYVKENCRGTAACYLDTSNEIGTALTQIYTSEHPFNKIDSRGTYGAVDMVDFALELLGKSKKLDDAIFLLLSRIGTRYGIDRVSIMEINPEYLSLRYSYQWARNKSDLQAGREFYLTRKAYDAIPKMYHDDGLCEKAVNPKTVMASCLQAAIWNQGVYAGDLAFESRQPNYAWTAEQRKILMEMTKLISSFIMKARADAVSKAKTDFLSRMSHEIRTPMNAIGGMTLLAKNVLNDPDKTMDCLTKIEAANNYLLDLINDILDMSRIESGKMELNLESAGLGLQMQKLDNLMRSQAEQKNVTLLFKREELPSRPVRMDVLRLNQVLINIIGNAIKFTEPGGTITVDASPVKVTDAGVSVRFSVKDTGIGISKEAQARIFNAFEQAGRETATQYGGTGLGLSISHRLVQMMGGALEVSSQPGRGSEFYFTVPFTFGSGMPKQTGLPDDPVPDLNILKGKRILLAEDNELNREIAKSILEMHGLVVETAENGKETLGKFSLHDAGYFDAVLMDIRMPVMDGLEATKKIRTLGKTDSRTIPIIAMTANGFDEDTKKSMESGMNGHLTKPIDLDKLLGVLHKCLI